jgi:hypothetical protein
MTQTYAADRTGLLIVDPYNDFMSACATRRSDRLSTAWWVSARCDQASS